MKKKPLGTIPFQGNSRPIFKAIKHDACVSIDPMMGMQVGFIAQLKRKLTKRRYRTATIFDDHFSRLLYIYLMMNIILV